MIGERQYKSWGDVSIYEAELFLTDPAGKIGGTWITSSSAYASCFFKETVGGCGIKEKKTAKLTFQETGLRIKSMENGSEIN